MKFLLNFASVICLAAVASSVSGAETVKVKGKSGRPVESARVVSSGEYLNEIQTSFMSGSVQSYKSGTQSVTQISGTASYARLIQPLIQVGGEAGLGYINSGSTTTTYMLVGIAKYNFDSDIKQSFYVDGGAGVFAVANSTGGSDSKFGFLVGAGKRLPLWERVSYNPEARIYKKGDLDANIEITFLNLSIMY